MSEVGNEFYIRLQTESRISATQWRQWAQALSLDPVEVVDVWDEIGYPILRATRQLPPISFVLQLRAERHQIDIFDFKDEVAPLISFLNLLAELKDNQLAKGKIIAALFQFYRRSVSSRATDSFALTLIDQFTVELCKLILVAKVLNKSNIALIDVLSMIARKSTPIEKVVQLGLQSLKGRPYADVVRKCLQGPPSAEEMEEERENEDAEYEDEDAEEEEYEERDDGEEGDGRENGEDSEEEEEDEGDEEEDNEGDNDEDEDAPPKKKKKATPMDRFVSDFRMALETIYAVRAGSDDSEAAGEERKQLNDRLSTISTFDPVNAIIPSFEEAEEIAVKRDRTIDPSRVLRVRSAPPKSSSSSARTSSPSGGSPAGGSATGSTSAGGGNQISAGDIAKMANAANTASKSIKTRSHDPFAEDSVDLQADGTGENADATGTTTPTGAAETPPTDTTETPPPTDTALDTGSATAADADTEESSTETSAETAPALDKAALAAALKAQDTEGSEEQEKQEQPSFEVAQEDIAQVIGANQSDFNQKVHQFGQLLAAAERGDENVWQLFLEPTREVEERQTLAAALATTGSPANQSFRLLRGVAQFIGLKQALQIPEQQSQKTRKFNVVVTGLINLTQAAHKTFRPDDRQLAPLKPVLDAACACLWRLETLRLNHLLAKQPPDLYSAENVEKQRLKSVGPVAVLADPDVLAAPRASADADTQAMLDLFSNENYAKELLDDIRLYAQELRDGHFLDTPQKLENALEDSPLEFSNATIAEPDPGELPENLLMSDEFGPVFQRVCNYICQQAWLVLSERHQPKETIPSVQDVLRAALSSCFTIQAEKRRHAMRPRLPISVISLGKLSGNSEFDAYYARVGVDGKLFYVENYEDDLHLDLMELREYTQVRMQGSGQSGDQEGDEPLQTGEKYLYTVGRSEQIFAAHPGELLDSCVREEDGAIKIFPIFRPKRS